MSRSWFLALAIACLLAVPSLILKIDRYRTLSIPGPSREARVLEFLAKRQFQTVSERLPDPLFLIHAHTDTCFMDLREVAPQGYDRSTVAKLAAGRPVFYVDNGKVSSQQPAWRTWAFFHLRRFAGFFGWTIAHRLTFAVTSRGSCDNLDWAELSAPAPEARPQNQV